MMIDQHVIDWKIAQLNGEQDQPMSQEMQNYVQQSPELSEELAFMEEFWQNEPAQPDVPSSHMRKQFYAMLASAEAQQKKAQLDVKANGADRWWHNIRNWVAPNPVGQFAVLAVVFVLGMNVSRFESPSAVDDGMATLQQQVSSLSSLVAISMLQKPSASERLTGVAYSSQTDLSDPQLTKTLIDLLIHDKSTAVRLAIINTLSQTNQINSNEQELIVLAVNETNPLVQMELCRLLLINGTSKTQRALLEKLKSIQLHDDVASFLEEIKATSRV